METHHCGKGSVITSSSALSPLQPTVCPAQEERPEDCLTDTQRTTPPANDAEGQEAAERQGATETSTGNPDVLDTAESNADSGYSEAMMPRFLAAHDDEANATPENSTTEVKEYCNMPSDGFKGPEEGVPRLENNVSTPADERTHPGADGVEELQATKPPSLVSFFRLSTDSTSSAYSSPAECSPRSEEGPCHLDSSVSAANDGQRRDKLVLAENHTRRSSAGSSWYALSSEAASTTAGVRSGRGAPLARLLRAFSHACEETSGLLHTLAHRAARSEVENRLATRRERATLLGMDTDRHATKFRPAAPRRETLTQVTAVISCPRVTSSAFAGKDQMSDAHCFSAPPADYSERFSSQSAYRGPQTGPRSALDCVCFERKPAAHLCQRADPSSSSGLFNKIARATGLVLASATSLVARAAAAAASAAEDDTDSEAGSASGCFSEVEDGAAGPVEGFAFTPEATPFQFVLWASQGSQLLLTSPLLAHPQMKAPVKATPADADPVHVALSPQEKKLWEIKRRLYCFRAAAFRLLLLICKNTAEWYPSLHSGSTADVDQALASSVAEKSSYRSTNGKARRRKEATATLSQCSNATAAGPARTAPQKGIFGYLVPDEADRLWEHWKRVAADKPDSPRGTKALTASRYGRPQLQEPTSRPSQCDSERISNEDRSQTDDSCIWQAARHMLRLDSELARLWASKVPESVSDEEFWKQYFYQVYQVMKRCELHVKRKLTISTRAYQQAKSGKPCAASNLSQGHRSRKKKRRCRRSRRAVHPSMQPQCSVSSARCSQEGSVATPQSFVTSQKAGT